MSCARYSQLHVVCKIHVQFFHGILNLPWATKSVHKLEYHVFELISPPPPHFLESLRISFGLKVNANFKFLQIKVKVGGQGHGIKKKFSMDRKASPQEIPMHIMEAASLSTVNATVKFFFQK